jgi:uncharacterized membrane protein
VDLTPYVGWIVFLHVLGAFMFVAGHGVSMYVTFQVRREDDRAKLAALLDLSGWSLALAGIGLLVLFISGIVAGIVLGSFGRAWLWLSLVLFVVIGALMTPVGGSYLRALREAIGQRPPNAKPGDPDPVPVSDEELATLRVSQKPEALLLLGAGGFVVILWLMMFKPF